MRASSSRPTFEPDRIAELRQIIAPMGWDETVQMLRVELVNGPATMRGLAASSDFDRMRGKAHDFQGAVANFGAAGVARAARAVELAEPGAELERALTRLQAEAGHAIVALNDLLFEQWRESPNRDDPLG